MTDTVVVDGTDVDDLVLSHLRLAHGLARRFVGRGEPLDDLRGVAQLALVRAAGRFDPERGVSFSTYAMVSVLGELKRHFRDHVWSVRAPRRLHDLVMQIGEARATLYQQLGSAPSVGDIADYLDCSEEDVLEAMEASGSYQTDSLDAPLGGDGLTLYDTLGGEDPGLEASAERAGLHGVLADLSERDRYLLNAYFFEHRSQADIGEDLNCSQMQVSRLLSRLLGQLRHRLNPPAAPFDE